MKKENRVLLLIILLLGLGVGFAYINTQLDIIGVATINRQSWNVYWANPVVTTGSVSDAVPTISNGDNDSINTNLNFSVNFTEPGQYYEFTVDAVNSGAYDAEITDIENKINNTDIDATPSPLPAYVSYTITYSDGTPVAIGNVLRKKTNNTPTVKKYKVRVEFLSNVDSSSLIGNEITLNFNYGVTYTQASNPPASVWTLPTGKTSSTLEFGDEVCVSTECFYFIKYDGNKALLLAKYDLNVGSNAYGGTATGIQNSAVTGRPYGDVKFSNTAYWSSTVSSYPADIYDSTNTNSVASYIESYKTKLINDFDAVIDGARLLTYDEVTSPLIGCVDAGSSEGTCPTTGTAAFITEATTWLGTAASSDSVYRINTSGSFYYRGYGQTGYMGVRPLLEIDKSNL